MLTPRLAWSDASEAMAQLFAMYALQHACGRSMQQSVAHWQGCSVEDVSRDLSRFVCVPALEASDWSERPHVALGMFAALAHRLSWRVLQRVMLQLQAMQLPVEMDDVMDRWVVSTSREAGYNLAGFFSSWGVAVRGDVAAELVHLPMALPPALQGAPE